MTATPWGNLKKSAVDDETIEQAIDRLIAVHEADPASHLGAGESLQSHKASEIIDHAALSIIQDKIANRQISAEKVADLQRLVNDINFETIGSWAYYGYWMQTLGQISFGVGGGFSSFSLLENSSELELTKFKITDWQCFLRLTNLAVADVAYFVFGQQYVDQTGHGQYIGFKVSNGNIYAVVGLWESGAIHEYSVLLGAINSAVHAIRFHYEPGVKIEFYLDDVLLYTETVHINFDSSRQMSTFQYSISGVSGGDYRYVDVFHPYAAQDF